MSLSSAVCIPQFLGCFIRVLLCCCLLLPPFVSAISSSTFFLSKISQSPNLPFFYFLLYDFTHSWHITFTMSVHQMVFQVDCTTYSINAAETNSSHYEKKKKKQLVPYLIPDMHFQMEAYLLLPLTIVKYLQLNITFD